MRNMSATSCNMALPCWIGRGVVVAYSGAAAAAAADEDAEAIFNEA